MKFQVDNLLQTERPFSVNQHLKFVPTNYDLKYLKFRGNTDLSLTCPPPLGTMMCIDRISLEIWYKYILVPSHFETFILVYGVIMKMKQLAFIVVTLWVTMSAL